MRRRDVATVTAAIAVLGAVAASRQERVRRVFSMVRLATRGGARYALSAPRIYAAAGEQRQALRQDLMLRNANDITRTLGTMKGVLMKVGQMASYIDESLDPNLRGPRARLQQTAPPMSPALAASVITRDFGRGPEQLFQQWDPVPIAAASIGQVHRALLHDGRAVAVKVQYPDVASTMHADLQNAALLRRVIGAAFKGVDTDALVAEVRERLTEELDYRREAANQHGFAALYAGHPTIRIPAVIDEFCSEHVLTQDLVTGSRFDEAQAWSDEERNLAAETIFRFVFGSLYRHRIFNGDPHPGNYILHGGGVVTFLDFGLVKEYDAADIATLLSAAERIVLGPDPAGFRRVVEAAGFVRPGAPVTDEQISDAFRPFYATVLERGDQAITAAYASELTRRMLDRSNPVAPYTDIPRPFVLLQRINLGLFAVIAQLRATANWRGIAEEIWPTVDGPAVTPMGRAEQLWIESRRSSEPLPARAGSSGS